MSSIRGTNVLAPVVPFDTTDSHASHEARYGKGGYRSVADIAERDAIPQLRREAGMLVLTMSDGKFWKLAADLAAWSEISLAGPQGPQGVAGVAGATGPQGPAGSAASATTSASDLTSGTLADARLSANVVLTSDSRLSNARAPTAHSHAVADVTGLQAALDGKQAAGSYAASSHTHTAGQVSGLATVATSGSYADLTSTPTTFTPSAHNQAWSTITSTPATLSGYGITDAVGSSDSRLSDARTPTSHTHEASAINSGTVATARLASGTADATTYLRGDQTWAAFSIADGSITSAKLADPFVYDCGAYSALVPAAPTGISGTPAVGSVALSWTAPTNTGGVSLTDYIVQYSTDQTNWTTFADGTSTATTATVTGLTGGTSYYFRVAAVNSVGTGAYVTSTAIAPSASKITISRTNGTSTFTGAGTSGSPYVRATEVLASNADGLQYYRFTASASCTVSFTITGIDAGLNGEVLSVRKNGTQVSSLDYNGYDGAGIARSGTATLASGDVLSFQQSYTSSAFKNVSVSAA